MNRLISILFLLVFSTGTIFSQTKEDWETGDFSSHNWYFTDKYNWQIVKDATKAHSGNYSIKSAPSSSYYKRDNSISLKIDVTKAGKLSFYYRTENESCCDQFQFYINGQYKGKYTSSEWELLEYELPTGLHTLKWIFYRSGGSTNKTDAAWIDDITFPEHSAPHVGTEAAYSILKTLFNDTNGTEWHNNKNWGTDAPLYAWHGVTVNAEGEPTRLNLGHSNLGGLTDLSGLTKLSHLYVANNKLNFGDLETANIPLSKFAYSPQRKIPVTETMTPDGLELVVNTSGKNLTYQWFKDGIEIKGATNNTLNIQNAGLGRYYCRIKHPTFIGLTLQTIEYGIGYQNGVTQEQYDALVAFYNETDGTNWHNNTNWLSDEPVSKWYGVIVSDKNVVKLSLNHNNLSNTIPEGIGNLKHLTVLELNSNRLSGTIPNEIGMLTNLEQLNLNYNQLSGAIPKEIEYLTELTYLQLNNNLLTEIPSEIGKLTELKHLDIGNNRLTKLPDEIGKLTELTSLDLGYNQLKVLPSKIGNLKKITLLDLYNNRLTVLPNTIVNLSELTFLNLGDNRLSGSIPADITKLSKLSELYLNKNQLSGTIAPEIWNLTNLNKLYLNNNRFSGTIPPQIGKLTNLKKISLSSNLFSGEIPKEIGGLTNLTHIYLANNKLEGSIPEQFGNLTKGYEIDLRNNAFSGEIPAGIGQFKTLKYLRLSNNNFTNLPDLSEINLHTLSIQNNSFDFSGLNSVKTSPSYFYYNPQKEIEITKTTNGTAIKFSITIDSPNSSIQWFKDGTAITASTASTLTVQDSETGIYHCEITDPDWPDLTLKSVQMAIGFEFEKLSHGVAVQDYNALVSFYHATNGNLWYDVNWNKWLKSFYVKDWHGVSVNNYRVTSINRNSEKLSGYLPATMADLTNLNYLYISHNNIKNIEALNGLKNLKNVYLDNNKFDFEDFETADLSVSGTYSYSPQKKIAVERTDSPDEITLRVSVPGTGNIYQWYKNSVAITSAVSANYTFDESENGIYSCEITNANFPNLTLYSAPVNVGMSLNHGVLEQDYLALVALFNTTGGKNWNNNEGWLSDKNVDEWHGITVKNCRVTKISLQRNNLTNTLPTELGNLTQLNLLSLSYNNLNGLTDLSNLNSISNIHLGYNKLTFIDLESTKQASHLSYHNQANSDITVTVQGDNTKILSQTPSADNHYKWYKDDVLIDGANSNSIIVANSEAGTYYCMITNNNYSSLTLQSKGHVIGTNMINGVVEQDYNALKDLFNSTNGENWKNNRGWLTGADVADWYGITVKKARVTEIHLTQNLLAGELPESLGDMKELVHINMHYNTLKGQLPESVVNLPKSPRLYFSNNSITDLPDCSLAKFTYMDMRYNYLQFDDLEPNNSLNIKYLNQRKAGNPSNLTPSNGEKIVLTTSIGGKNNKYQWYKDDTAIKDATSSTYTIGNYQETDAGKYHCVATNTVVSDLSISSESTYIDTSTSRYSVNLSTKGGGKLSGGRTYNRGAKVTITATASPNFTFVGWKYRYGNKLITTDNTYSFNITSWMHFEAVFKYTPTPEYRIRATVNGNGTVAGFGKFKEGTEATLTATTDVNNEFVNWTEGGQIVSADAAISFEASKNRTLTANFVPVYYIKTTVAPTAGGTTTGAGKYYTDDKATVKATVSKGYKFIEWQENEKTVSTLPEFSFSVTGSRDLVAVFEKLPYVISASTYPANATTVTGTGKYHEGKNVSLSVTKKLGFRFINWTEAGKEVSTSETYDFKATADRTLVANFKTIPLHTLSLNTTDTKAGKVEGNGVYEEGDQVTIKAKAVTGYSFVNWTEKSNGNVVSTRATYTFNIKSSKTLVANFRVLERYQIAATVTPENGGQVKGTGTVYEGNVVNMKAAPSIGYQFVTWKKNGTVVSPDPAYSFVASENTELVAVFKKKQLTVSIATSPNIGGNSTGAGNYEYGDDVTVEAVPNTGYEFVGWKKGNLIISQEAAYTFAATEDIHLVAQFTQIVYTVGATATPETGGQITGTGKYTHGKKITVSAIPKTGHQFVAWKENGVVVSKNGQYSFTVTTNRNFTAEFKKKEFTVNTGTYPVGLGTITDSGTFEYGTNITISATPPEGYRFINWKKGNIVVSTRAEYSFSVKSDVDLTANFERKDVKISVNYNRSQASVSGAGAFKFGDSVTLEVKPKDGYRFDGWVENGEVISTGTTLDFDILADRTLSLKLTKLFTVGLTVSPAEGGSVEGEGTFAEGEEVTIKAIAQDGYQFMNWTSYGREVSKEAEYTFKAARNIKLVANFSKLTSIFGTKELAVKAYPNPASDYLQIELSEVITQNLKIYLTSINGQRSNLEIRRESKNIKVDLAGFKPGQYILQIVSGNELIATKKVQIR